MDATQSETLALAAAMPCHATPSKPARPSKSRFESHGGINRSYPVDVLQADAGGLDYRLFTKRNDPLSRCCCCCVMSRRLSRFIHAHHSCLDDSCYLAFTCALPLLLIDC